MADSVDGILTGPDAAPPTAAKVSADAPSPPGGDNPTPPPPVRAFTRPRKSVLWKPWSWWRRVPADERLAQAELAARMPPRNAVERFAEAMLIWGPVWVPLGVLAIAWFYRPYVLDGPEVCGFHRATGLPCPTCGMTRSFCFFAHGEWRAAFDFNALGPPSFLVLGLVAILASLRRLRLLDVEFVPPKGLWWTLSAIFVVSYTVRLWLLVRA